MVLEYKPTAKPKEIPHDKKAYLKSLIEHYDDMISESRERIKNIEEQMRREKKRLEVDEMKSKHYKQLLKKVM